MCKTQACTQLCKLRKTWRAAWGTLGLAKCYNVTYGASMRGFRDTSGVIANGRRLDQLGIGLGGLCVLHCLATIALVSGLGLGGHFLLAPEFHRVGLALALIIAALALGRGMLRDRSPLPLALALAGLSIMAAALLVDHGPLEVGLTIAGVLLVSLAHGLNLHCRARGT